MPSGREALAGEGRLLSIRPLEFLLAQDSHDVNARARPLEDETIISGPEAIEVFLVSSKLLDSLAVWDGIVSETGAIGKDLIRDLVRQLVEVALGLLGQEDAEGHPFLAFGLALRAI